MAELLAAVPWQAWAAGVVAAVIGGVCAVLAGADPEAAQIDQVEDDDPTGDLIDACPDLDDLAWDVGLDEDVWARASRRGDHDREEGWW